MTAFTDDSAGFADLERDHVRRYVPGFDWVEFSAPSPRIAPAVGLSQARIGLVSTAGAHPHDADAMAPGGEIRALPVGATVVLTHPGYDTRRASQDVDVVYPVASLLALAARGAIGSLAPTAISTMGFIPDGRAVLERLAPLAVSNLRAEQVDLALLVPA
jgi:D-proline reductase (dithiol) PrdB